MSDAHYARIRQLESDHWWFVGTRRLVKDAIARADLGGECTVLDAGCGSGLLLESLPASLRRVGIDVSISRFGEPAAANPAAYVRGSVEQLPFGNASFDAVVSVDVLSNAGVRDDAIALREFRRVLRLNGLLVLNLPAYDWLTSAHDVASATRKRYRASDVRRLLHSTGFGGIRVGYRVTLLFVPAALLRLLRRGGNDSDVRVTSPALNKALTRVLDLENRWLRRRRLPFGLSVYALARADG